MPTRPRRPARDPPSSWSLALLAVALAAATAAASASRLTVERRPARHAAALRPRHVGLVRRHDRSRDAGCRPTASTSDGTTQRPDLDHEHRRLHVEHAGRRAARDHRPCRSGRAARPDAALARDDGAPRSRAASTTTGTTTRTGAKLTIWPPTGAPITPILSSVDNGWLATGAARRRQQPSPSSRPRAEALFDSMDFGFYYRPAVNRIAFHYAPDTGDSPCCYDTIVSESRIASYIGIAKGELPERRSTSAPGGPSPTRATGAGRRPSRSAFHRTYSASTSSRAPTRTTACASCRAGAAACSRR